VEDLRSQTRRSRRPTRRKVGRFAAGIALLLDGVFGLLGEFDDVAVFEEDLLQREPPLLLPAG
jgi:hypothetical protein